MFKAEYSLVLGKVLALKNVLITLFAPNVMIIWICASEIFTPSFNCF